MPISGYFDTIFGEAGTLTPVPDAPPGDGSVCYELGWAPDYSLPLTNPSSLLVGRGQMNQLFFDLTTAVQQYQQNSVAPFITTTMNGGSPYSYPKGIKVLSGGVIYESLVASNTTTPPSSSWGTSGFTHVSSTTGYQQFSNGLIMQWQPVTVTTSAVATLPIAFPNVSMLAFATAGGHTPATGLSITAEITSLSTSTITLSDAISHSINLLSFGY